MKRLLVIAGVFALSCALHAQVVDTTVCDILKNPKSFNGKIVRVSGTVIAGLDQFVIKGDGCGQNLNAIWLSYPEGTKAKSGSAAILQLQPAHNFAGTVTASSRTPVTLEKDKNFKQFDSLLSATYKEGGLCLGCVRNEVSATLVGRLDGTDAGLRRDSAGKIVSIEGFGNMNAYSARLVLQSVSNVASHAIDYSKNAAATKDDTVLETDPGDVVADIHKAASAYGAGNLAGEDVERAATVFGKPQDSNGVVVTYGATNEDSPAFETANEATSPDGVIFHAAFNTSHLKGSAHVIAAALIGEQIADIRTPRQGESPGDIFIRESHAWETATLTAIGSGLKTFRAPGGYLMWNHAWPQGDRQKLAEQAFRDFLANQELMSQ